MVELHAPAPSAVALTTVLQKKETPMRSRLFGVELIGGGVVSEV